MTKPSAPFVIEEHAVVVALERDDALLEIVRRTPCGLCGQTQGCGVSMWGRLLGHKNNVFRAANMLNAKVGDHVVVGIAEEALLASSLRAYGVPLLLIMAGAWLGTLPDPAHGDAWAVAGALAGLVAGLMWLKGRAGFYVPNTQYRPVILRAADGGIPVRVCHRG